MTPVRTAAATRARQRAAARRAAIRLGVEQVEHLDDSYLIALASALVGEAERRRLTIPTEFPAVRHESPAVRHQVGHSDAPQK